MHPGMSISLLREMKRRALKVTQQQFTDLLLSCSMIGYFPAFEEIARSFGEAGHQPNSVVFAAEVLALGREQKWAEMRDLVAGSDVTDSIMLNTAMLSCVQVNDQLALQLFDEFALTSSQSSSPAASSTARFAVDNVTILAGLVACHSMKDQQRAQHLYELANKLNIRLNLQSIMYLVATMGSNHPLCSGSDPRFVIARSAVDMCNEFFIEICSQTAPACELQQHPLKFVDYLVQNGIYLSGQRPFFKLTAQASIELEQAIAELSLSETLNPSINPKSVLPNFVIFDTLQRYGEATVKFQQEAQQQQQLTPEL